jgi:hypothetical protein
VITSQYSPSNPRTSSTRVMTPTPEATELVREVVRLEAYFERGLRDLRVLRDNLTRSQKDKGVLGSRGLTEFVVEYLKSVSGLTKDIHQILIAAEAAGYAIPIARTLSKRLTRRAYTHGDIAWSKIVEGWYWKGSSK